MLRAIVEDFIATNEPVGSKTLVERHNLGVSSATIRNDMAALEEDGLIHQPHTSAGRVPTDAGYRMFVDRLGEIKPLSGAEKRAISAFLDGAVDLDDVLHRAVRALAQLTRNVAVVQYPTLSRSRVRHLELVMISHHPPHAGADHRHRARRAAAWSSCQHRRPTRTCSTCGRRSTHACATGRCPSARDRGVVAAAGRSRAAGTARHPDDRAARGADRTVAIASCSAARRT